MHYHLDYVRVINLYLYDEWFCCENIMITV